MIVSRSALETLVTPLDVSRAREASMSLAVELSLRPELCLR